jgi:hypothetical protein
VRGARPPVGAAKASELSDRDAFLLNVTAAARFVLNLACLDVDRREEGHHGIRKVLAIVIHAELRELGELALDLRNFLQDRRVFALSGDQASFDLCDLVLEVADDFFVAASVVGALGHG